MYLAARASGKRQTRRNAAAQSLRSPPPRPREGQPGCPEGPPRFGVGLEGVVGPREPNQVDDDEAAGDAQLDANGKGSPQVQLLHSLKSRRDAEEGFTLIELMVVVLIIAILIAIAIPTFLGARQRAQDRAAQSDLRNGLTAEKTYYTDNEEYTDVAADLQDIEPSLDWGGDLSVAVSADASVVCVSQDSKSGTTFSLADVATGADAGTYYERGACSTDVATVSGWNTDGW
jgi:type IV pilus assembly protein PilA